MEENQIISIIDHNQLNDFTDKSEYVEYLQLCKELFYKTQSSSIKRSTLFKVFQCDFVAKNAGFILNIDWAVNDLKVCFDQIEQEPQYEVISNSDIKLIRLLRQHRDTLKLIMSIEKEFKLNIFNIDRLTSILVFYDSYWFNGGNRGKPV